LDENPSTLTYSHPIQNPLSSAHASGPAEQSKHLAEHDPGSTNHGTAGDSFNIRSTSETSDDLSNRPSRNTFRIAEALEGPSGSPVSFNQHNPSHPVSSEHYLDILTLLLHTHTWLVSCQFRETNSNRWW
jgi:hypothetical protein